MAYLFASFVAVSPADGQLITNSSGQIFAPDDTNLETPLTVTVDGSAVTEVRTGPQGIVEAFVSDLPIVVFKSAGAPAINIASLQAMADAATGAQTAAEAAQAAAEEAADWAEQAGGGTSGGSARVMYGDGWPAERPDDGGKPLLFDDTALAINNGANTDGPPAGIVSDGDYWWTIVYGGN